jgi:hypothetical protein
VPHLRGTGLLYPASLACFVWSEYLVPQAHFVVVFWLLTIIVLRCNICITKGGCYGFNVYAVAGGTG